MPPKAKREMPKERAERMDQRERVAGFLGAVAHNHAESVSVAPCDKFIS